MTLAENEVVPRRAGDLELATHYRDTIQRVSRVVSFDGAAADKFAELRVNPPFRRQTRFNSVARLRLE